MNSKINKLIEKYDIDLTNLVILTEAASGPYVLNPFIALAANAKKVICKTTHSHFAKAENVIADTIELAKKFQFEDRIFVKDNLDDLDYSSADIITNSGHLRPITKDQINLLKSTAVIPLMWETWEFHDGYLDIAACKQNEILVMGTNESHPPCDMRNYGAAFGLKLLFEAGLEIAGNKIILLGSTDTLCSPIKRAIENLGGEVIWFSSLFPSLGGNHYSKLKSYIIENAAQIDGILFAEHLFPEEIMSNAFGVSFWELYDLNPNIKIAISCGNINIDSLVNSKLHYYPRKIESFGYMTYQSYHLGALPVMDLFAAGLKVGEAMARARLAGHDIRESAICAMQNSPAQDFEGELSWI